MEKFRFLKIKDVKKLPKASGVYVFKNGGLLYIGKAVDLKERVKNHFQQPAYKDNFFIDRVSKIGYIKTDSEIEALILEANLIKKYQPKYNVMWRDDKNYFYVTITKEEFPRVLISHQLRERAKYIGPFIEGKSLKRTLTYLRRVFPYYVTKKHPTGNCLWCNLKLCPGPNPDRKEYQKNIKNLTLVLRGYSKTVLKNLKKEMKKASVLQNFERAAKSRDRINALEKVMSYYNILEPMEIKIQPFWTRTQKTLQQILRIKKKISRIEAYDISNIQGQLATGSMVTFINGQPDKDFYRKFKIKIQGKPNDFAMIQETLNRRFKHSEWDFPDLILIDGGRAQLNTALKVKKNKKIFVMALSKKENKLYLKNKKEPILLENLPREIFNLILQLRDEAHRFAISYHKNLRLRTLFPRYARK